MKIITPGILVTSITMNKVKCFACDCVFEMNKFHTVNAVTSPALEIQKPLPSDFNGIDNDEGFDYVVCPQYRCNQLVHVADNTIDASLVEVTKVQAREMIKDAQKYREQSYRDWKSYHPATRILSA